MTPRAARDGSVYLIGFMASGKSAVGRELAKLLCRPFVDTDREIERKARRTVPQLFAARGERAFRALEAKAVGAAAKLSGAVVAVGGGAVLSAANVSRMRRSGRVVYLEVAPIRLWARARAAGLHKRPLLAAPTDEESRRRLDDLLARRRPLYRRAAHLTVRADAPAREVAAKVARRLGVR